MNPVVSFFSACLFSMIGWSAVANGLFLPALALAIQHEKPPAAPSENTASEKTLLTNIRQLTFEGRRAGEGYFSPDGSLLVFQSERRADNPFFQIYLLDFETGDVEPLSPGYGKTTCAWVHWDNNRVLFSSTQNDPQAKAKQKQEIEFRESGQTKRYAWDYDPEYEIFAFDRHKKTYTQLTNAMGYDAEGSYSPDGKLIAFASNRNAYAGELSPADQKKFDTDPAVMMEIFIMNADGSNVKQLTDTMGYDGGPFFSPDGTRICWRRFAENGLTAEIMTMKIDGSNQRRLTNMGAMSWAPFYHPSGKYLIFTTNKHGFGNFELYLVAADGKSEPVRVTDTDGFDGLASFSPDGKQLTWTSNRNAKKESQIYLAKWDHAAAVNALSQSPMIKWDKKIGTGSGDPRTAKDGTAEKIGTGSETRAQQPTLNEERRKALELLARDQPAAAMVGIAAAKQAREDFDPQDIMRHVDYLCRPELSGRMTGSPGERKATAYVAAYMDYLGLRPAGDNGTWFQAFEFPDGAELGPKNDFEFRTHDAAPKKLAVDEDWRPLTFSGNVEISATDVIFAGYGIVAPAQGEQAAYNSYRRRLPRKRTDSRLSLRERSEGEVEDEGDDENEDVKEIDVKDKWVLVLRFVPENVSPETRQHLQFYAELRKKAFHARDKGAKGLIVVSGPNSQVRNELVPLQNDFSPSGSSIAAISITDEVANQWLQLAGKTLKTLQDELDDGKNIECFEIPNLQVAATLDIKKITGQGRNVIGRLAAADQPTPLALIVGAHIDHLGLGKTGGSLAKQDEQNSIHFGADDNASGVAGMLEIAEYLSAQQKSGKLKLKHDVIFAGWSGEELGLHGSHHFVDTLAKSQLKLESKGDKRIDKSEPGEESKSASFHDFVLSINADGLVLLNGELANQADLDGSLKFIGKSVPDFEVTIAVDPNAPPDRLEELIERVKQYGVQKVTVKVSEIGSGQAPRKILAALNMDMIGRLTDKLILQGISSSGVWQGLIESKNAVVGLPLTLSNDTDLPTDASSFYQGGIPILSAFTGSHTDYHTPRDTPEKLNYPEAARIAKLMGLIARSLATSDVIPNYIRQESKPKTVSRSGQRAYLGSVPSYGDDVVGVKLADVTKGAPAEVAGLKSGDIIVELAGKKIENIYDYTAVIDVLKIGQSTTIIVDRDGTRIALTITPGSRD